MEPHEIEEKMLDAVEKINKYGEFHAKYKSVAWGMQRNEKNIIAILMKKSEQKTTAAQEREAYASEEYVDHTAKASIAIRNEVLAQHKLDYYKAMFETMRSLMSLAKKQWDTT